MPKEEGGVGRRRCSSPGVFDFFFPIFDWLLEAFLFDGFLEEGLVLVVVFGRGAGLLDDICEVEMQRKMVLEIGSWRCTFKKSESDMQRGGMSRNVTIAEDGSGWHFDGGSRALNFDESSWR